jgi:hypothetical protein
MVFLVFNVIVLPLFAQTNVNRIAPGAETQLSSLLNSPAMVRPAVATPLGRNWFRLETDAHVFAEGISARQVAEVFLDIENQEKFFDGRRSKTSATRAGTTDDDALIVDFVSIGIVIGFQLRTPYRAVIRSVIDTDTRIALDIRQTPQDSEANTRIKNLVASRYAEDVIINGRNFTYIRLYSIMDVDASILPGARGVLERNSAPTNVEALEMTIAAARLK